MGNIYKLRYLPVAVDDLISIFDWISNDNPDMAVSFIEKLDQSLWNLQNHPFLGRVPRDDKLKNSGYRVLVFESYLVFYLIRGKVVEVQRVIHGSRKLDHILFSDFS